MAAPNAIVCAMCGQKFFKASLPFHQKVCSQRTGIPLIFCNHCSSKVPQVELDQHRQKCCPSKKIEIPEYVDNQIRKECKICQRKFALDRIDKHQGICERKSAKSAKPSFKIRTKATLSNQASISSSGSQNHCRINDVVKHTGGSPQAMHNKRMSPLIESSRGSGNKGEISTSNITSPDNHMLHAWGI